MPSDCSLHNITYFRKVDYDNDRVASSLFYADGCLCVIFALLTHFQYSSVTVLNYSFNARVTSNARWIWFFILAAESSIMNGLNFWLNINGKTSTPFIIGWISHLLAVLLLAFAIKYQWKYREQAYQDMSSESETTPLLSSQTARRYLSLADYLLLAFFVIACVFFIIGLKKKKDVFYWISFGSSWSIRIAIFVIVFFIIHYKTSEGGPSIFTKYMLLAGVVLNVPSDIPSYIWIKCALQNVNLHRKEEFYDSFIGLVILSHVAFFIVLRSEFLRLRDITRWHIANNIDHIERDQSAGPHMA